MISSTTEILRCQDVELIWSRRLALFVSSDSRSHTTFKLRRMCVCVCVCTANNIRRFYGKNTGNQLPVQFPFLTGARKHFQESGTVR